MSGWNSEEEIELPQGQGMQHQQNQYRGDRGDRGDRSNRDRDRGDTRTFYRNTNYSNTSNNTNWRNNTSTGSGAAAGAGDQGDVVYVPSDKVGMIIGRGGAKIKELQSASGARINVDRNRSDDGNTKVHLSGSEEAKNEAKRLIEETISESRDYRSDRKPRDDNYSENRDYRSERKPRYDNFSENRDYRLDRKPREDNYSENRDYRPDRRPRNDNNRQNHSKSSYSFNRDEGQQNNSQSSYAYGNEGQETEEIDWQKIYQDSQKKKWELAKSLAPILKEFYIEDPHVAGMSEKEVAEWRFENNDIHVSQIDEDGNEIHEFKIPNPVHTFNQAFAHYPEILEEIRKQGFSKPSPIQSQAWPILLSGKDLIGIAQTGTGKTLAFLLPALIHIEKQTVPMEDRDGPNVLVLAPTRELAIQIENEVKKYHYCGIKSVCIYGGADKGAQIDKVSKGVQIVIATPGRLNDLVNGGQINLKGVTYVVLDEADRMLDMGFGPQITLSLQDVRPDRQTVMTSATWPLMVQRLALNMMSNPVRIVVGKLELAAVNTVTQQFVFVEDTVEAKYELLVNFLQEMEPDDKLIVFCSKKATTIDVSSDLGMSGYNIQSIYGGLDQADREQALEDMRNNTVNILIATDLASRGIDIEDVTHIINFDFPQHLEEFVHRVGRTGRAGKNGTAITYITRRDWSKAAGLIDILKNANQEVPEELHDMADRFNKMLERKKEEGGDDRRRSGPYNRNRSNY